MSIAPLSACRLSQESSLIYWLRKVPILILSDTTHKRCLKNLVTSDLSVWSAHVKFDLFKTSVYTTGCITEAKRFCIFLL